jgi:hypothetical protein
MAIIARWSGLGLADGIAVDNTTVGAGDVAFDTVTSGAWSIDAGGEYLPRLQMDQAAATAAQAVWSAGTLGTLTGYAVRGYLEMTAYPSAGAPILQAFSAASLRWRLDITSAGLMRLRDSANTIIATAATPLEAGDVLRVEVVVTGTSATAHAYLGDSTTALVTLAGTVGSGADEVRFGNTQTAPTWPRLLWDELAVANTAALIGPVAEVPPRFPLDDRYELGLGQWTDITGYVYERDEVTITRGRADEATATERSTATLTLDNRDGRFSSRNPLGAWYGLIGRNTPLRISIPSATGEPNLLLHGEFADQVATPDAPALGITGDIDIRFEGTAPTWQTLTDMCGKYDSAGDQRSWQFQVRASGHLMLVWSVDGTFANRHLVESTIPLPDQRGRLALRVTLDVDNGAGGHVVTFYTGPGLAGPWTQLGDPVVGTGTTTVFDGTAPLQLGAVKGFIGPFRGRVHGMEVRNGIAGAPVANPRFSLQPAGTTVFTDAAGRTWTLEGQAEVVDRDFRFWGEVSTWPQSWDRSGADVHVKITASGILRRLGQGASPLSSTLYRGMTTLTTNAPIVYWPCEDGQGATQFASALPDGRPIQINGSPQMAASSAFAASGPIPEIGTSTWVAPIPAYFATGEQQLRFFMAIPADGLGADRVICRIFTTGEAARWDFVYKAPGGALQFIIYDADNLQLYAGLIWGFAVNGENNRIGLNLYNNGAHSDFEIVTLNVDDGTSNASLETINNYNVDNVRSVVFNPDAADLGQTAIGHISLQPDATTIADMTAESRAYLGEAAGDRFERLCGEEVIAFTGVGNLDASTTMGPQRPKTLVELLQECADADLGILFEPRDSFGLGYRARESLYNQDPAVVLDYAGAQIAGDLTPLDDDLDTRNDITAQRDGGSSARVVLQEGPLSVASPPAGVGRYEEQVTINVATDEQLPSQASWRLHLGTTDEARYPVLSVNLRSPHIGADLAADLLALDVGDRIAVTNLPDWLPPGDLSQLVQGYTETLRRYEHTLTYTLSPESPWRVGVYDTDHYDTAGAELAAGVDADDTALSVATTLGPVWTSNPADMPFDIDLGGEQITVTAVAGTTSPQTFTVTRSVNGVTKPHSAGAAVSLWDPAVYAL